MLITYNFHVRLFVLSWYLDLLQLCIVLQFHYNYIGFVIFERVTHSSQLTFDITCHLYYVMQYIVCYYLYLFDVIVVTFMVFTYRIRSETL